MPNLRTSLQFSEVDTGRRIFVGRTDNSNCGAGSALMATQRFVDDFETCDTLERPVTDTPPMLAVADGK
jgi:hypothetical protein